MRVFRKVSSMPETSYISTDDRFAAVFKRLGVEGTTRAETSVPKLCLPLKIQPYPERQRDYRTRHLALSNTFCRTHSAQGVCRRHAKGQIGRLDGHLCKPAVAHPLPPPPFKPADTPKKGRAYLTSR